MREHVSISDVGKAGIGIEIDRTFRLSFSRGPIPIKPKVNKGERGMGFSERLV